MNSIEELNKACNIAEKSAVGLLLKSHVKQYTRSDGTVVQEHDDSRHKAAVVVSSITGTKAGFVHGLSQGGTLRREVQIGKSTFPVGSVIRVLPGGIFIHHDGIKKDTSVGSQWHNTYGQGVQSKEENLRKLAEAL